ncbi:MAG: cadmium-translocating P-type ATPase [Spirochaetales bacterium]|nr:cadmium-translocating P-type ATPase [Spirochaetales bacterium]
MNSAHDHHHTDCAPGGSGACPDDGCHACAVNARPLPRSGTRLMSAERARELARILAALALGAAGILLWETKALGAVVAGSVLAAAYLLAGTPVLLGAARNIARGRVFDELFLMAVASLGAFAIGAMEEAVGVMVFYTLGEFLQEGAAEKSRRSISAVLELRPDKARVLRDGLWTDATPDDVEPGDFVLVRPGERVPVDGVVTEGSGSFDTSALTGESMPRSVAPGGQALAGFISIDAALTIRAERAASASQASRVIELVERAAKAKARTELFISRFAKWYTPAVVFASLALALLPPLLVPGQRLSVWAYRALVMLVISCPCAFVISVPLGYLGGLGGAARRGILIKGANVLDALADARTVVFDKTGTLTDGSFRVTELLPEPGVDPDELLRHAAAAGTHSNHPLARAVRDAWQVTGRPHPGCDAGSYSELPGHGTAATLDGREVLAGSDGILHLRSVPHDCRPSSESVIHVAAGGRYLGRIEAGDTLKADAPDSVDRLRALGIRRVAMLTGDAPAPAQRAAAAAGVSELHHGLLPKGKLERLEAILADERGRGTVIFVGDGINDAPALARADAGIAMGASGADAAVESADVVLMGHEPSLVAEAVSRARRTRRIVTQNILLALGVKLVFLGFGAFGLAAMWEAVIADVGVALAAVLNSTRALK